MEKKKTVKIVVLGDIGHSPRMANHATSLAEFGHTVDIIGYGESELPHQITSACNIYPHFLIPCPKISSKLLNYIWKTIWTSFNLLFLLVITRRADIVLVQNPPAIPSLFISWFYCKSMGAQLIIDWHNYAHTIMALSVGKNNTLVSVTRKMEEFMGRRADYNLCVSKAMKNDLYNNWGVKAEVLYDRPNARFRSVSREAMHIFLKDLSKKKGFEIFNDRTDENATLLTQYESKKGVSLKMDRPAFVVSSTSWTEDEDFSVLFNALQDYENHWNTGNKRKLPNMVVAITGKGPLKEFYLKNIASRGWKHVTVITPWLEDKDYPLFIGCADIGISLHTSSSGLDLPMKIVDLYGANVPVLAYDFKALNELVVEGKNGYIFSNEKQLSKLLLDLFERFPSNETVNRNMEKMKSELTFFGNWDAIWNINCKPIIDGTCSK